MDAMTTPSRPFIGQQQEPGPSDAPALMAVEKIAAPAQGAGPPTDRACGCNWREGLLAGMAFSNSMVGLVRPATVWGAYATGPYGLCMEPLPSSTVLDYNRPGIDPELARRCCPW